MFLNIPYAVFGYNETRDVHKIHIHSNLAHVKQNHVHIIEIFNCFYSVNCSVFDTFCCAK